MEVRFGDCVYRFAFPALPMVLFNHFRTVSVHTAYIPRTYPKLYKKSRVFYGRGRCRVCIVLGIPAYIFLAHVLTLSLPTNTPENRRSPMV